ncbi:hypothetical protein [Streptomyces cylindrosporus]|uniref:Uncharacterized protein n=1 Tax=Streptomyces cylindrosporus TaxID=2927583 RepID=A0ABS9YBP1_9ACTN|nr:hypothetical protein [Streptomyces cylindrosporus]MCI3273970.1 hypothetical protein [Streptomyces cylindrosporus]
MDEGVAAIAAGAVGVLGAALGGLAAILGAKIGADRNAAALLHQIRHQRHAEQEQWVRGQRSTAYAEFLTAWHEYTLARGRFHSELPPRYENWRRVQDLGGRLFTTVFRIRIVGPRSVAVVAEEALTAVTAMELPEAVRAEFDEANARYRETGDPDLQERLVRIAERILYQGSWDGATDVESARQRFLDAATEALGDLRITPEG